MHLDAVLAEWRPLGPDDVLANLAMPGRLWSAHFFYNRVAERAGADVIGLGDIDEPEMGQWLDFLARHRVSALAGTPSQLGAVLRHCARAGHPLARQLRTAIWFGEPLDDALLERLGEIAPELGLWGNYGSTETWVIGHNGPACDRGTFHVLPHQHVEIDGGRVLVTTLSPQAVSPIIRYRIGDRGRWVACSCGRPGAALRVLGREDSLVKFAGTLVSPQELVAVATSLEGVSAAQVALHVRRGGRRAARAARDRRRGRARGGRARAAAGLADRPALRPARQRRRAARAVRRAARAQRADRQDAGARARWGHRHERRCRSIRPRPRSTRRPRSRSRSPSASGSCAAAGSTRRRFAATSSSTSARPIPRCARSPTGGPADIAGSRLPLRRVGHLQGHDRRRRLRDPARDHERLPALPARVRRDRVAPRARRAGLRRQGRDDRMRARLGAAQPQPALPARLRRRIEQRLGGRGRRRLLRRVGRNRFRRLPALAGDLLRRDGAAPDAASRAAARRARRRAEHGVRRVRHAQRGRPRLAVAPPPPRRAARRWRPRRAARRRCGCASAPPPASRCTPRSTRCCARSATRSTTTGTPSSARRCTTSGSVAPTPGSCSPARRTTATARCCAIPTSRCRPARRRRSRPAPASTTPASQRCAGCRRPPARAWPRSCARTATCSCCRSRPGWPTPPAACPRRPSPRPPSRRATSR